MYTLSIDRQRIHIRGQVQGVGFRPAVYRLATGLGLTGLVRNDTQGVAIEVQGSPEAIAEFVGRIQVRDRPPLARIESCVAEPVPAVPREDRFRIEASEGQGIPMSQVTADVAVCGACLSEMDDPGDFRYRYPFINCTNCGPRYSIVRRIPYDRPNTTMSEFRMCDRCGSQYHDVNDRRFHAQPVACPVCGPRSWLTDNRGAPVETETRAGIVKAALLLRQGMVVAVKGIGGFHLMVDALNDQAVQRLRRRKRRDHKPFAMMAASIEEIRRHADVDQAAEQVLTGPQCPIVLLPKKAGSSIAESVAPGVNRYGFMLCYAPLQCLLLDEGPQVLVATSANLSDEPLICDNDMAVARLGEVADAFLMHDRRVFRQVDDSIIHFIEGRPSLLRRSRGYVPTPILLASSCPMEIMAVGPDLKNTFCLVKADQLICSEHIGDLADAEVYHHYCRSIGHLQGLFEVEPKVVACDLHPAYFSTLYAKALSGVQVIEVQHHWAHVASVLAEHRERGPVIGLVADGTGYGTDGAIWGCECLIASLERFERFGHLDYFQLAGGDKAAKEPIRPLMGLLRHCVDGFQPEAFDWLLNRIEPDVNKQRVLADQLAQSVNCVNTSSLGRVFDAVAAMAGVGRFNHFDAQLPMALEAIADSQTEDVYPFDLVRNVGSPVHLRLDRAIRAIVEDSRTGLSPAIVSARLHNTIASALVSMARLARDQTGLENAAISGGVFCNRYLAGRVIALLNKAGFRVLWNRNVPSNDGGISIGQAAIAASIVDRDSQTVY